MKIHELYQQKKPVISLEIFPPKKESGLQSLTAMLDEVEQLHPDFISVTYGAGGTAVNNKTLAIAKMLEVDHHIPALHHITGVGKTKAELEQLLGTIQRAGIENLLALRGDLPLDAPNVGHDFPLAKDLIHFAKKFGDFSAAAACYPEGHIERLASTENPQHMLAKQEAGADFFISQLFFDNDFFYRMEENARQAGITKPISAGVMPIMSRSQVEKMIFMCGASLPSKLIKLIHKYEYNQDDLRKAALDYAIEQCQELIAHGVDGVHLYSMNRPVVAKTALHILKG